MSNKFVELFWKDVPFTRNSYVAGAPPDPAVKTTLSDEQKVSLGAEEEIEAIGRGSIVKSIIPESSKQAVGDELSYTRTIISSLSTSEDDEKFCEACLDWIETPFTKNSYSTPPEAIKTISAFKQEVNVAGALIAPPFAVKPGMGSISTLTKKLFVGKVHETPLSEVTVSLL